MNIHYYMDSKEEWEDREARFAELSKMGISEIISDGLYWRSALPHIDQPDEVKETFYNAFKGKALFESRRKSDLGVVGYNRREALCILDSISIYNRCSNKEKMREFASLLAQHIARHLDYFVSDKRHEVFSQLADILKNGTQPSFTGVSGGVWRCFCAYHLESWKLPTKGELRKLTGLNYSEFSKALKPLGLTGLPKGSC